MIWIYCLYFVFFCKLIFFEFSVCDFLSVISFIKLVLVLIGFILGTLLAINRLFSGSDMILAYVLRCGLDVS